MADLNRAIELLGYDGSASGDFVEQRSLLVQEAAHSYPRRRRIVDAVPEDLLRAPNPDASTVEAWRTRLAEHLGEPSPA